MVLVYRKAVFDDDLLELQNTGHILTEYQEEHSEYDINISYYTEAITFLNEVYADRDRAEWAYDILFMDIYLPAGISCLKQWTRQSKSLHRNARYGLEKTVIVKYRYMIRKKNAESPLRSFCLNGFTETNNQKGGSKWGTRKIWKTQKMWKIWKL